VVDDVKSFGSKLKLREARLEFRGSGKEDSEVIVEVGIVGLIVEPGVIRAHC
jgi:hypothetical protein